MLTSKALVLVHKQKIGQKKSRTIASGRGTIKAPIPWIREEGKAGERQGHFAKRKKKPVGILVQKVANACDRRGNCRKFFMGKKEIRKRKRKKGDYDLRNPERWELIPVSKKT